MVSFIFYVSFSHPESGFSLLKDSFASVGVTPSVSRSITALDFSQGENMKTSMTILSRASVLASKAVYAYVSLAFLAFEPCCLLKIQG